VISSRKVFSPLWKDQASFIFIKQYPFSRANLNSSEKKNPEKVPAGQIDLTSSATPSPATSTSSETSYEGDLSSPRAPSSSTPSAPTPSTSSTSSLRKTSTRNSMNSTLQAIQMMTQAMQTQTNAILHSNQAILEAIRLQNTKPAFNWTPIVQAAATALPAALGVPVTSTQPSAAPAPGEGQVSGELVSRLNKMTSNIDTLSEGFNQISSSLEILAQSQAQLTSTVTQLSQDFSTLTQIVASKGPDSNDSGSTPPAASSAPPAASSAPPAAPASSSSSQGNAAPATTSSPMLSETSQLTKEIDVTPHALNLPPSRQLHSSAVIAAGKPFEKDLPLDSIVTADLESLITKEGLNTVYMAAWYKGVDQTLEVFDITDYDDNVNKMLRVFWSSLLTRAKGCTVFFHNWAGYDAILSLGSLISLHDLGYTFNPIVRDGKLISLTVLLDGKVQLTIKDSIKLIPGAKIG
jgi:uncharacterized protein YoxC